MGCRNLYEKIRTYFFSIFQVYDEWMAKGVIMTKYDKAMLMSEDYDQTELAIEADKRINSFQPDAAKNARVFHHLITLPTYHTTALSSEMLAKDYFGQMGMLAYVKGVQRIEIRNNVAAVKHQVNNYESFLKALAKKFR